MRRKRRKFSHYRVMLDGRPCAVSKTVHPRGILYPLPDAGDYLFPIPRRPEAAWRGTGVARDKIKTLIRRTVRLATKITTARGMAEGWKYARLAGVSAADFTIVPVLEPKHEKAEP